MDLATAAGELYGLRPDRFTAARNDYAARARSEVGPHLAAEVRRLRRPTTGGWVLNLLAREDRGELEAVVELGGRLREAVGVLGADELRALDRQRRELTRAVAARGGQLAEAAGHPVAPPVLAAVEESLRAAMVDEPAGRAVLTGVLLDTFSSTGLDPVALDRVLAVPGLVAGAAVAPTSPARPSRDRPERPAEDPDAARREAARARLEEAEDAARQAEAAAEEAEAALHVAVRARREADREVADLQQRLADAKAAAERAREAESSSRAAQESARGRRRRAAEARARAGREAAEWLPGARPG